MSYVSEQYITNLEEGFNPYWRWLDKIDIEKFKIQLQKLYPNTIIEEDYDDSDDTTTIEVKSKLSKYESIRFIFNTKYQDFIDMDISGGGPKIGMAIYTLLRLGYKRIDFPRKIDTEWQEYEHPMFGLQSKSNYVDRMIKYFKREFKHNPNIRIINKVIDIMFE